MTNANKSRTSASTVADEIAAITDRVCAEHLDVEYGELCRKAIAKLARKRPSPLLRGETRTWAAGVIYAMGMVNFLTDPTGRPHMTTDRLSEVTGVGKSTLAAKFRAIQDRSASARWTRATAGASCSPRIRSPGWAR
jgi:hypothetical protein